MTDEYDGNIEYDRSLAELAHKTIRDPKVIVCKVCGHELTLDSAWSNECECGLEYNGFGQRLAPRSQWGEETGEQF